MSRSPALLDIKSDMLPGYAPTFGDGIIQEALNRAKIGDLETAITAISEAEKLIDAQRRKIAYLETLALNDDVTGLMNRRGFMAALQRELAAAKRDAQAHGILIMMDLDGFKGINDTHGHAAGDAYLAAFAGALSAEVRGSDVVARLGGDEFALLMTRIAGKPGLARAQAIMKNVNAKTMNWRQSALPLRTSAGMAAYAGRDIAEAVMVSADLKLYANKLKRKSAASR